MYRLSLVGLCALGLSMAATAADEMVGYKGFKLLSGPSVMKDSNKYWCRRPKNELGDTLCVSRYPDADSIAGEDVRTINFSYYEDKLHSIYLLVAPTSIDSVVAALTSKYGMPGVKSEIVQNRMNAKYENKKYLWDKASAGVIEVTTYAGDLNTGSVEFRTPERMQIFNERIQIKEQKRNLDL